jgi:hypothetical protein
MSNNNELIYLPVSLGEAIDKLTILDIKIEKIKDNRQNDVKIEYELLYKDLKDFIIKYENLYETMRKVNLLIWVMMDILRDGEVNEEKYLKICKECIEYNDIRFRVKNKINCVSKSCLKEQKSYKINRLIIVINKDLNNNDTFLNIVKYLSFIYDEIIIESKFNLDCVQDYFLYDNTIIFKKKIIGQIDYKDMVTLDNKEYNCNNLYDLFNITEKEIKKII